MIEWFKAEREHPILDIFSSQPLGHTHQRIVVISALMYRREVKG